MLFPVILYRNKSHLPIPWCVKNNVFRSVFISDTSEQYAKLRTWFDRLSSEAAFQDATKTLFPKVELLLKVTFTLVCTGWGSQMKVKIYGLYLYQIFMSKYLHSFIPFFSLGIFQVYVQTHSAPPSPNVHTSDLYKTKDTPARQASKASACTEVKCCNQLFHRRCSIRVFGRMPLKSWEIHMIVVEF